MRIANVHIVRQSEPRSRGTRRATAAPLYSSARDIGDGSGEVWENGVAFNPVSRSAARAIPCWRFDWGDRSTSAGREWLAWALHERLGLDRANLRHASAFHRLVTYLGGLPAAGWTRTLDEFRAVARGSVPPMQHDASGDPVVAAAS